MSRLSSLNTQSISAEEQNARTMAINLINEGRQAQDVRNIVTKRTGLNIDAFISEQLNNRQQGQRQSFNEQNRNWRD